MVAGSSPARGVGKTRGWPMRLTPFSSSVRILSEFSSSRVSANGDDVALLWRFGEVGIDAAEGFPLVGVGSDVVAEEHAHCAVSRDAHCDRLRYASADHVADGGSS